MKYQTFAVVLLVGLLLQPGTAQDATSACTSLAEADSIAISIVFAICNGNVQSASEAIAAASASGCGNSYAAGIGVGVASITQTGNGVVADAFSGALTLAITQDNAVAMTAALAVAIASNDPSTAVIPVERLLVDVAAAIQLTAEVHNCEVAGTVAITFYQTLQSVAPGLAATFAAAVQAQVVSCPQYQDLAAAAAAHDTTAIDNTVAETAPEQPGGTTSGSVETPIFTTEVDRQMKSASLAVQIANTTCAADGSHIAAVAIATAAVDDTGVASTAIAASVTQGVDVTKVFKILLTTPTNGAAVTSVANALVASTGDTRTALAGYMGAAVADIAAHGGCDVAVQAVQLFQAALSPTVLSELCGTAQVPVCGDGCIWVLPELPAAGTPCGQTA